MEFQPTPRNTEAHEIGHMYLHKYLSSQFRFNNISEWVAAINQIPIREREIVEWQANEFAGLILVPRSILKNAFKTHKPINGNVKTYKYNKRSGFEKIMMTIIAPLSNMKTFMPKVMVLVMIKANASKTKNFDCSL